MKTVYPEYNRANGTKEIEERLSEQDKTILFDFMKLCRVSAGEKRVNEKIKCCMLQFYDIIEKPFNQWILKDIQEYIILLNNSKRTEWTKNDVKKILRRFLKFQYKKHEDLDTMLSLIKCKSDKDAFNYQRVNENTLISESEFEKMLRSANTLKQKAILSLLLETATRPQELRTLKWNDIKLDDDLGSITVFSGKTKKSRTIPIQTSLFHLKQYKHNYEFPEVRNDDYVFPNPQDRNQPLGNNALPTMFRRLSKKAGLSRNIFPYLLRHTRITEINKKLPAHLESKFAGHSIKQSQMYTHLSSDDLREAMKEKVFNVKDISPERKHELEEKIDQLSHRIEQIQKENYERLLTIAKNLNVSI